MVARPSGGLPRRSLLFVGAVAAGSVAGATAWACVPQPIITSLQPRASGVPGDRVTVVGENFEPAPVEIRWNATDGPLIEKASGPTFSVAVRIPDGEPGLYTLIALSRQTSGAVIGTARAAFQVTAGSDRKPAKRTTQADGGGGSSSSDGVPRSAAVAGGAGLVVLGAAGGALMSSRRRRR